MALEKEHTDARGFSAPAAYFRITQVDGNWAFKQARIKVAVYKDKDARDSNLQPMDTLKLVIHQQGGWDDVLDVEVLSEPANNPVRAVYGWLKQKPEFEGAVDV